MFIIDRFEGDFAVAEDENGELSLASVDKADFADGSSIS